jgi:hypothetical protein
MHTREPIGSVRLALLIAVFGISTLALARALSAHLGRAPSFESALVDLALAALALMSLWATAILLTLFLEALTGGRTRGLSLAVCPRTWRRGVLALCGATLVLGVTAPTYAVSSAPGPAGSPGQLPHLDRPEGGPPTALVVHPGDSLWRLVARRHLGSSDAEIARLTQALYAGNRTVIGDDPDLIEPGQRLAPTDHLADHLAGETGRMPQ